jgi:hypothetical protein
MSQQLGAALQFIQRHPDALRAIMLLSISATAGKILHLKMSKWPCQSSSFTVVLSMAFFFVPNGVDKTGGALKDTHVMLAGQLIIVHTIRTFGAIVFATVMTTRQFVSILLSSIVFNHPLSPGQW